MDEENINYISINSLCVHNWLDVSTYGTGYLAEKCFMCGEIRYFKIFWVAPSGDLCTMEVDEADVPQEARIS